MNLKVFLRLQMFIVSLPLLFEHPFFTFLKPFLATYPALLFITLLSVILMNVKLPLFSFKIQSFSFSKYGYQLVLLTLTFPVFYFLQWVAVPIMILLYLFLNVIKNSFN